MPDTKRINLHGMQNSKYRTERPEYSNLLHERYRGCSYRIKELKAQVVKMRTGKALRTGGRQ